MNVNGMYYSIIGLENYREDFEEVVKEGLLNSESVLMDAIESHMLGEYIRVELGSEATKSGGPVTFWFSVVLDDMEADDFDGLEHVIQDTGVIWLTYMSMCPA